MNKWEAPATGEITRQIVGYFLPWSLWSLCDSISCCCRFTGSLFYHHFLQQHDWNMNYFSESSLRRIKYPNMNAGLRIALKFWALAIHADQDNTPKKQTREKALLLNRFFLQNKSREKSTLNIFTIYFVKLFSTEVGDFLLEKLYIKWRQLYYFLHKKTFCSF